MAALSKSEYLKRYISKDELPAEDRKKKKKRKIKPGTSNMRIIDDDIDIRRSKTNENPLLNPFDDEDQPMVVDVIDERPQHVRESEVYQDKSQWKTFGAEDDGIIIPGNDNRPARKRHDSDSDASPPRNARRKARHDSDSDESPPRNNPVRASNSNSGVSRSQGSSGRGGNIERQGKKRHDSDSEEAPARNIARADSDSDHSPPRRNKTVSDSDHSPPRRKKADSDSDHSPPRRKKAAGSHSDQSFPRRKKAGSDSDHSPPRRKKAGSDSDQSPPRRKKAGSDSDHSPPRRRKAGSDSDQSPPRRKKAGSDSDQSPPRKRKRKSRFESSAPRNDKHPSRQTRDLSPSRKKRHDSDSDASPPRRKGGHSDIASSKPQKTLSGATAGLSSATEMRKEAKALRDMEDRSFGKIDDETLGKHAQTVMRDKSTGRRRNLDAEKKQTEEEARKEEEKKARFQRWGKGIQQQDERDQRLADQVHEASKPLARYQDDQDLDTMMRGEERSEDPMLAFIRNKKKKKDEKSGKGEKKELPRYKGASQPPPNRYNLWPGYRWDGVDRSNGFEKKIFASIANKKATKEIAYKWSIEEM